MRIAIPTWCGRVSPVFDVAKHLVLVDVEAGAQVNRDEARIEDSRPWGRVRRLSELEVNTLICGAISRPLERMLASVGIRVIAHACGAVEEVLGAFLAGSLMTEDAFLMPGASARCRRRRRIRASGGDGGQVGKKSVQEG